MRRVAGVAKSVDAGALKAPGPGRAGSSPAARTIIRQAFPIVPSRRSAVCRQMREEKILNELSQISNVCPNLINRPSPFSGFRQSAAWKPERLPA